MTFTISPKLHDIFRGLPPDILKKLIKLAQYQNYEEFLNIIKKTGKSEIDMGHLITYLNDSIKNMKEIKSFFEISLYEEDEE